jgi:hypothetical protein
MKTLIFTLLGLTVLTGCATPAQQQSKQLEHNFQAAIASMSNCFSPTLQSPVANRLRKILILDIDDPKTVEKLALNRYVTEQEAKDIIELSGLRKPCHRISVESFSKVHPEFVAVLARKFSAEDLDAAKAINHELTIGVVNQHLVDRFNRAEAEFLKITQRIASQLKQARQYEASQRRIAQQELRNWQLQQRALRIKQQEISANRPAINLLSRPLTLPARRTPTPTTTNCNYYGDTLRCTHY